MAAPSFHLRTSRSGTPSRSPMSPSLTANSKRSATSTGVSWGKNVCSWCLLEDMGLHATLRTQALSKPRRCQNCEIRPAIRGLPFTILTTRITRMTQRFEHNLVEHPRLEHRQRSKHSTTESSSACVTCSALAEDKEGTNTASATFTQYAGRASILLCFATAGAATEAGRKFGREVWHRRFWQSALMELGFCCATLGRVRRNAPEASDSASRPSPAGMPKVLTSEIVELFRLRKRTGMNVRDQGEDPTEHGTESNHPASRSCAAPILVRIHQSCCRATRSACLAPCSKVHARVIEVLSRHFEEGEGNRKLVHLHRDTKHHHRHLALASMALPNIHVSESHAECQ